MPERNFNRPVLVTIFVLLLGCGSQDKVVQHVFGEKNTYDTVATASEVNAFLIGPKHQELRMSDATVDDYPIATGPINITPERASQLIASITSTNTYDWDSAKACIPTPGVRIRFTKNGNHVDVLFCFECNILGVYKNGAIVGGEDFDNGRPQIVRFMKQVFPDNPVIQNLPETGCGLGSPTDT